MTDPDALFYVLISAVSFITFLGVFSLSPWISKFISTSYKHLPPGKQVDWDTRIGSNIHAIVATVTAIYALLFDEAIARDHFCTDSLIVRSGISVTFGYILADFVIILWYYQYFGDIFTVIHHIMGLWAYMFVVASGYLLFFGNIRQIAEISTPFVNQRWFYDVLEYPRNSRCFITNGLLMVFSFFVGRIVFMPYFYYKTFSVWSSPQRVALGPVLSSYWIITAGTLDLINLFWFRKMVKGATKLLLNQNKENRHD